ncbi:hypothetical protein DMN91_008758 [Ooceraea biroi]|uniref:Uncharacterized protein n=1 Tax=Ooceraea biroi TaxID=2015173 RepID=A0A3L8DDK3_OOCBI|nr:hypothetical protein DMN91_008758 [Ooceraea biroi]
MENVVDATDAVYAAAAMAADTAAALVAKTRETEADLNRLGRGPLCRNGAGHGIDEVLQYRLQFFDEIWPIINRGIGWQYARANTPPPE